MPTNGAEVASLSTLQPILKFFKVNYVWCRALKLIKKHEHRNMKCEEITQKSCVENCENDMTKI